MIDGALNVELKGDLLKFYYPKLTVMRGFERTVSILFNAVSKIPLGTQTIQAHKAIYIFWIRHIS